MTAKNKIYITIGVWLALCVAAFGYFFGIFDGSNQIAISQISEMKKEVSVLEAEQRSYVQATQDLNRVAKLPMQPEEFFSQDVTLVKEIETLESLGNKLGVRFELSGLSGTIKTASKANTRSELFTVPYNISLVGPFPRVVDFIETMENLAFITHLNSLAISSSGSNDVSANLTAIFYLRKK